MKNKPYNHQLASAMVSVCCSMASSAMRGALIINDPIVAARSFGDSTKWQLAGIIATLGDPESVLEFLRISDDTSERQLPAEGGGKNG